MHDVYKTFNLSAILAYIGSSHVFNNILHQRQWKIISDQWHRNKYNLKDLIISNHTKSKTQILVIIYVRFKSIRYLFILLRVSIICILEEKKVFHLLTQWEKAALFHGRRLNMLGPYDTQTVFVIISQPMESRVILLLSFCLFSLSLEPTVFSSELHGGRRAKTWKKSEWMKLSIWIC